MAVIETKLYCSTPSCSTLFEVVLCLVERAIEEINTRVQGFRSAILIYGEGRKRSRGRRNRY
jgi:hypothetical protein